MVENPPLNEFHVRVLCECLLCARHAILEIGGALIATKNRDRSLLAHGFGEKVHGSLATRLVISSIESKALTLGSIGIETHDRHAF